MQLEKPVMAQGNVEVWLGTLLEMSRKSVHHVIRTAHTAVQDQGFNLLEFLSTFPAQVRTVKTHAPGTCPPSSERPSSDKCF